MKTRMEKIDQICRKFRVKALYLFGSRRADMLRFLQHETFQLSSSQSDLDIGVRTHSPFSVESKIELTLALEEIFDLPTVDLFVLQEVDAFLAANIIRGDRIFAEDSYFADEYDLFVLRRAGDLAEYERQRMALILQEM